MWAAAHGGPEACESCVIKVSLRHERGPLFLFCLTKSELSAQTRRKCKVPEPEGVSLSTPGAGAGVEGLEGSGTELAWGTGWVGQSIALAARHPCEHPYPLLCQRLDSPCSYSQPQPRAEGDRAVEFLL